MLRIALALLLLFPALALGQAPPEFKLAPAKIVQPRDGIGNLLAKLRDGKEVRIAYLGGSITAAPGWRVKSRELFAKLYPEAKISEINAAIGGTGSDLGVYRVERDALNQQPDLLFVEFAVNDGGAKPLQIWQAMEGIVRKTWAANPQTDICFVYTFRTGYETDLRDANCPQAASAMEALAEHYHIPSINFALRISELEKDGKLLFQAAEPVQDKIRFSEDGVHPLDQGHTIYTDILAESLPALIPIPAVEHREKLEKPFVSSHWQAAKMIPIEAKMLSGEWAELPAEANLTKSFGNRMGTIWEGSKPGNKISLRFRGSTLKLYDLLGPDGGQVTVTIDGVVREKPVPRFDSYCTYHRLATLSVADGLDPEKVHEVTIEIHSEQPDRNPVAFRLKDPETELKSPKYQGTYLRVGQVLVLGELLELEQK